ncbi:hypothetical protein GGR58DRAFT_472482 [Xylaria digitata]|nr:hypothetical protein GGR58DRAFT_472482 [Xylaria digitata]
MSTMSLRKSLLRRSVGPVYLEQTGTEPKASKTEPQNTMHLDRKAQVLQKPIIRLALDILTQLKPNIAQPYIDSRDWDKYCITCGQLDLSGEPENGGDFLRLIPSEEMQQIASQYGFDHLDDLSTDPDHPFHNSDFVVDHLNDHLFSLYENDYLVNRSKWLSQGPDEWEARKLQYFPGEAKWQVDCILGVRDGHLPHMNCTLKESEKLCENKLLFSEVWSILMVTLVSLHYARNEKHNVVPVTVVTFSGTTFRLVQGFIDGEAGRVRINKSGIVTMNPDGGNVTQHMMLILRWLLAEPLGPSSG